MDFSLTLEQARFRDEVRSWLRSNVPGDWESRPLFGPETPEALYGFLRDWQRRLFGAGFVGPTWQMEYGGRDRSYMEELIFNEEVALAKAPPILNLLGIYLAGPTIIAYGTEAQKQRLLPKILSGEEIWCQGYSEPNAGSDLASLQTRAVRDGDDYVVNGSKIWSSSAHKANWCFFLARTDPEAPKHKGISYLICPMDLPGISVNPLVNMADEHNFNEIVFDNVRVPTKYLVGEENRGWD